MSNVLVTYEPFAALADPVRRVILGLLSRESMNVTHLVQHFEVSRPAISRHLRVLRQVGLVSEVKIGRERLYSVEREVLEEAAEYLRSLAEGSAEVDSAPLGDPPEPIEPQEEASGWRQW